VDPDPRHLVAPVPQPAEPARHKWSNPLYSEVFFGGRPPAFVFGLGFVFTVSVAIVDHFLTGSRIFVSLSLLYLMPIGLVTWNLGRTAGLVMSGIASVCGLIAESSVILEGQINFVSYMNAVVRFAVLIVISMLVATLRESVLSQKRVAEQERQASLQLRELNEMKNTLLHAVSHDLKGPLSAILGSISTLQRGRQLGITDDERDGLFEAIQLSGGKMNRLVNDLLDLDRIDRGQLQPEREPTDVGRLAKRVARECETLGPHPVRVESDPVVVDIDAGRVERIVENLLVNAARHTPVGTPIRIFVKAKAAGVQLIVEDEGPGVPDELKQSLFDPFRQGPHAAGMGVGLGLSLVRRFAELHGGAARVEDRGGGGARFVIDLPGQVTALDVTSRLRAV
jgi:two-component system sensor histidine kinase KdpD